MTKYSNRADYKPLPNELKVGDFAVNIPKNIMYTKTPDGKIIVVGAGGNYLQEGSVFMVGYTMDTEYTIIPCDASGTPSDLQIDITLFEQYSGGQKAPISEVPLGTKMVIIGGTINAVTQLNEGDAIPAFAEISGAKTLNDIVVIKLIEVATDIIMHQSNIVFSINGQNGTSGGRGSIKQLVDVYNPAYTTTTDGNPINIIVKWRYTGQTNWYTATATTDSWSDLVNDILPLEIYKQAMGDQFHFQLFDSDLAGALPVNARYAVCAVSGTSYNVNDWDYNITEHIHGSLLVDNSIFAQKIYVQTLSALTANLGTITAGVLYDSTWNGSTYKMKVDLNNGIIHIK